ncbi:GntR family transcriptional regulator [Ramlibacter tataouinensis]|uniref:Transcriptional regulator, GntR family-like protein n=1 Tax=Ramlibacter tataouinensis (strain ATCC BAA-407 / DSM 14655 / LMG 21543 / TTB310) TaxID=365046 RepID=F5XZ94_RAMTT|nr:GntR family transcriptional regulator [Ramlibacter tataouinensis]AEG93264.1 transcriptional regulator, GntR family-like protein [Ramlibacter tataouinensis TTB310]
MNPPQSIDSAPALRAAGTALHRQLFMVLRDEIARGVYAATGALPKEEALGERFQVSRITVRRALADLAALGLVERRHGLGTFVKAAPDMARETPSLGFIDSLRQVASDTQVQVLQVERVPPPPMVSALLQIAAGEAALHAFRLRSVDGVPVMITEAWVPAFVGRRVTTARLRKLPLYQVLQEEGVKFGRVVQELTAQVASPDVARSLQVEVGSPLLKLVRLMHDVEARPVQHLTALLPPERSRVLMDIPGDKVNTLDAGQVVHDVGLPRRGGADRSQKRR